MMRIVFRMPKSHELHNEILKKGHRTFLGLGLVEKVVWKFFLSSKKENGIPLPTKWYSDSFEETGRTVLESISALSRGIPKRKWSKDTIHFN